jgi:hypothetical protein
MKCTLYSAAVAAFFVIFITGYGLADNKLVKEGPGIVYAPAETYWRANIC